MDAKQGNRKAFLAVSVLFVLGIALGSVGTYLVSMRVQAARPQAQATMAHNPGHTMAMYTRDLNLNGDQQTQIQTILNSMRSQYAALHEKLDPEYEQVRQEGREQIRQVLTPDQRPKFEELLRQIDEDRRRRAAGEGHD
jgi:Spy/CpxP family protein refolding chaperone